MSNPTVGGASKYRVDKSGRTPVRQACGPFARGTYFRSEQQVRVAGIQQNSIQIIRLRRIHRLAGGGRGSAPACRGAGLSLPWATDCGTPSGLFGRSFAGAKPVRAQTGMSAPSDEMFCSQTGMSAPPNWMAGLCPSSSQTGMSAPRNECLRHWAGWHDRAVRRIPAVGGIRRR